MAGHMLECALNETYDDIIATHLFKPLGILTYGFGMPLGRDTPWGHGDHVSLSLSLSLSLSISLRVFFSILLVSYSISSGTLQSQPLSSSITLCNITSIAYNHHTDI